LQFFNDELEKVLIAEEKEDDSSARTSYVSNGRSSHGSTITLIQLLDNRKQQVERKSRERHWIMRKILKGRKGSGGMIDNASADKKLNKILHMFRRNVHPESATKSQNRSRHVMNSSSVNDDGYKRRDQMLSGEGFTQRDTSKMSAINTRTTIPQATCGASDSNWNREFWIKSDADYMVLEL
nr:hypothetical protein [Tanacetum cinerariifolium]